MQTVDNPSPGTAAPADFPDDLSALFQTAITPRQGWQAPAWRELWHYRDLFYFLVRRDTKARYTQSILGFGWAILQPFATMIVFSVIFGELARMPSEGVPYPLFAYAALVPWTYFASALTASTSSLVASASVITKVYFPRLVVPMSPVLSKLVDFAVALGLLGLLLLWYRVPPTANVVFLPLLLLLMVGTAAGLGMWLSALAIQYRDVDYAMGFLTTFLMYLAPVAWPLSLLGDRYGATVRLLYGLYPMAGVIEGFRAALLGTAPMPWDLIGMGALSAVFLLITGSLYFTHMEHIFADVA